MHLGEWPHPGELLVAQRRVVGIALCGRGDRGILRLARHHEARPPVLSQRPRLPGLACRGRYPAAFAVSAIPSAFMTASVVFRVGLPFSLKDR